MKNKYFVVLMNPRTNAHIFGEAASEKNITEFRDVVALRDALLDITKEAQNTKSHNKWIVLNWRRFEAPD